LTELLLVCRGELPKGEDLLIKDDVVKLKRCIFSAQVFVKLSWIWAEFKQGTGPTVRMGVSKSQIQIITILIMSSNATHVDCCSRVVLPTVLYSRSLMHVTNVCRTFTHVRVGTCEASRFDYESDNTTIPILLDSKVTG